MVRSSLVVFLSIVLMIISINRSGADETSTETTSSTSSISSTTTTVNTDTASSSTTSISSKSSTSTSTSTTMTTTMISASTASINSTNLTCAVCTGTGCKNSTTSGKCAGSCYFVSIQASQADDKKGIFHSRSGCVSSQLDSEVKYSLTIFIIRTGLAFVAVAQCSFDNCNSPVDHEYTSTDNVSTRWSEIGVQLKRTESNRGRPCRFTRKSELINVQWDHDDRVIGNVSDWCGPQCDPDTIRYPRSNQTLCQWFREARGELDDGSEDEEPKPDRDHLGVDGGVFGGVFVLGIVIGIFEFRKRTDKPMDHLKKSASHRPKSVTPTMSKKSDRATSVRPSSTTKESVRLNPTVESPSVKSSINLSTAKSVGVSKKLASSKKAVVEGKVKSSIRTSGSVV